MNSVKAKPRCTRGTPFYYARNYWSLGVVSISASIGAIYLLLVTPSEIFRKIENMCHILNEEERKNQKLDLKYGFNRRDRPIPEEHVGENF